MSFAVLRVPFASRFDRDRITPLCGLIVRSSVLTLPRGGSLCMQIYANGSAVVGFPGVGGVRNK